MLNGWPTSRTPSEKTDYTPFTLKQDTLAVCSDYALQFSSSKLNYRFHYKNEKANYPHVQTVLQKNNERFGIANNFNYVFFLFCRSKLAHIKCERTFIADT